MVPLNKKISSSQFSVSFVKLILNYNTGYGNQAIKSDTTGISLGWNYQIQNSGSSKSSQSDCKNVGMIPDEQDNEMLCRRFMLGITLLLSRSLYVSCEYNSD